MIFTKYVLAIILMTTTNVIILQNAAMSQKLMKMLFIIR